MNTLFALALLWCLSPGTSHPLHVSVTEIEYDEKEKELEVTMRIFADDLESALKQELGIPDLDLMHPTGTTTTEMMNKYVSKYFSVSLDQKSQPLHYLGEELDGNVLICYVQVPNVKKWKSITVHNRVIIDLHQDQSNLVHVTVRGEVRSMRLTEDNLEDTLTFN